MRWYVHINGSQSGPHPESDILALARSGRLQPTDLVRSEGMPNWAAADQTQPFAGVYAGMPPGTPSPERLGDDPLFRFVAPVGRSGWAIAAGYLAFFSVFLFPAPLAVYTGIIAIVDIKRDKNKHGMGRAIFGIIMGSLFTVLLLLALISRH